jgi:ketosteroid isomerase-like protein
MSEQENLEIVQRGYKAFAEGDLPTLLKLLADDVEWNFPPTYVGIPWTQHPWPNAPAHARISRITPENALNRGLGGGERWI